MHLIQSNQEANGVQKKIITRRHNHVNIKSFEIYKNDEVLIYFLENDANEIIKMIQKIEDIYPPNSIIRFYDYKCKPIQDYKTVQNEDTQIDRN